MSKFNVKPTQGYVLIEPLEKEAKTAGGIYLPDNAGEKPQKGTVLAVGDDLKDFKKPCKQKDVVYYKKWGGNEIKKDGKEYLLVKFEDVLAIEN